MIGYLFAAVFCLLYLSARKKLRDTGKEFVANASHELRTPMTVLKGFAEILQEHPNISGVQLKEIAGKLVSTAHRLEKVVKSLTILTDVEWASKQFQSIDLVPIVEECSRFLLSVCPDAQLSLRSEAPSVPVFADAGLLDMALINLLENAVKYSEGPASIAVSIEQTAGEVRVQVKDAGIGISSEEMRHIFERFYRVDKGRSRKLGGIGLGLSIVKTIMEKHQGRVEVQSELGQGSVFTLVLPKK